MKTKLTPLALVMSALLGAPFMAANTQINDTDATELSEIKVEGQRNRDRMGHNQVYSDNLSSMYLGKNEIDLFRGSHTADLFKGMAGVQIGEARNSGGIDPNVRGIQGQGRVPVTVDGTEQAISVHRGYAGANNRNYIDPMLLSSIRVEKGPSLSRGMENSVGGGIAMTTLAAEDVLLPEHNFGIDFRIEAGNNARRRTDPFKAHIGQAVSAGTSADDLAIIDPHTKRGHSFGHNQAYRLALAGRHDRFKWVAAYAFREQGNYFAGSKLPDLDNLLYPPAALHPSLLKQQANQEVPNTGYRNHSLIIKSEYQITPDQAISLGYTRIYSEYGDVLPSQFSFNKQLQHSTLKMDNWNLQYRFAPESRWWDMRAGLWQTRAHTDMRNGLNPNVVNVGGVWTEQPSNVALNRRIGFNLSNRMQLLPNLALTLDGSAQYETLRPDNSFSYATQEKDASRHEQKFSFNFDWIPHPMWSVSAGMRYNRYSSIDHNLLRNPASLNEGWFSHMTFDYTDAAGHLHSGENGYIWAADASGRFHFADDPRNNGKPQANGHTLTGNSNIFTACIMATAPSSLPYCQHRHALLNKQRGSAWSPVLAVSFKPFTGTRLYLRHAHASKMPSLFEGATGMPGSAIGILNPERARNTEIGIVQDFRPFLGTDTEAANLKISYYRNHIKNAIDRNTNMLMNGINLDEWRTSGLEIQARYDNGRFFAELAYNRRLTNQVCDEHRAAVASVLGTDARVCRPDGFPMGLISSMKPPRHSFSLGMGARFLDRRLEVGTRINHFAAADNLEESFASFGDPVPWPKTTTYDAYLRYHIRPNMTFDISGSNLTNRYYSDPLSRNGQPAPGRTIKLGFNVKF